MPEPLLQVLKICLLILLYLFFFRVLRAVWAEVTLGAAKPDRRTKARALARTPRRQAPPMLTVTEPAELAGTVFPLGDELTVGRAAGCQITLDDTYVSQIHARIFTRDDQLYVEDLGSTNGTYLNRRKVSAPMLVSRGDHLQIGSTVLEVT